MKLKTTAIVVAAGSSLRVGLSSKKQFVKIDQIPLMVYPLRTISLSFMIDKIILVLPEEDIGLGKEIVKEYSLDKVSLITKGGKKRQESVYEGIKATDPDSDIIMIHDAARAFVTLDIIERSILMAESNKTAIVAIESSDSLREVINNKVTGYLDRDKVYRIQTPQSFNYDIIKKAHEDGIKNNIKAEDDSFLVSNLGYEINIVKGSQLNFKVTTKEDLILAEAIVKTGMMKYEK